ncbi:MAG: HU family DNA-binding protein [Prevotella sp.]|nr:HU family DNA-binding protein [Prevotellaceae bacterium]MDY5844282.1 HU family DNA-binding protein [Prevotella sp.]
MAFYKKVKMKVNGKWYPKSVLVGSAVTTEQVARRVAAESTVSPADVRAVLTALGGVMGDYMAQGRSVKLDGIGSFYFTAQAERNGVATEEEVTAALINGVRVRFIPETRYRGGGTRAAGGGRRAVRGLSDMDIEWEEWKGKVEPDGSGTPPGGGENPLP